MPAVSVILNCFNGEKYLKEAIDSVVNQSFTDWEIIFFDNCSTDNSKNIFDCYKDSRLKYFSSKQNISLAMARNLALKECIGEYIAFLDVDDVWFPKKLEKQLALFDSKDVGMSCSSYIKINERNNTEEICNIPNISNSKIVNELLIDYFIHISTFMFRSDVLGSNNLSFDNRFSIIEDFDFAIKMSLTTNCSSCSDILGSYRWHQNNYGYITNYKLGEEFDLWINEEVNQNLFSSYGGYNSLEKRAKWYKVVKNIYDGKKLSLLVNFLEYTFLQKLKILFALVTPTIILKKLILRN
tara:strand:- start:1159 stop:2049 length:891 start_codon:yes stop_codon:yes gene_type:complete